MKKIYLSMTLLATSLAFADSGEEVAAMKKTQPAPAAAEARPFIEYNNRMAVFGPFHQVYERTKPDAFYVGVEAWAVPTLTDQTKHNEAILGEAELRMGYNFFYNGRDHVTPFAGIGVLKDYNSEHSETWIFIDGDLYKHRNSSKHKPAIVYGVLGFLYDHEFNRFFALGSNFKFLVGGSSSHKQQNWGNPVVGFDFSLPITFRFGYKRHWDIRIEPFDIYLHGSDTSRNYFGFRSTVGYRF